MVPALYVLPPRFVRRFALLTLGLTWKKFRGSPAACALARCAAVFVERLLTNVPGAGCCAASAFTYVELVKSAEVYFVESPACATGTPLKYASVVGSGAVFVPDPK